MTAIMERSVVDLTAVKAHLRLPESDTSEDLILQLFLDGAKQAADGFCSNPFEDEDEEELPIPAFVEVWILRKVASLYTYRESVVSAQAMPGAGYVTLTQDDKRELFPGWKPFI